MDVRERRQPGEIRGLLDLLEEHPAAFIYDFRTRFGLGPAALFDGTLTWAEAHHLARALISDPSSYLAAAVEGWEYPFSRESMILADLYDLTLAANTDRRKRSQVKPYRRPYRQPTESRRSRAPVVDQAAVRAALAARGHDVRR